MTLVNVKMEIWELVANGWGSVFNAFVSILLSICFSFLALNSSTVFSMAFTSSSLAIIFASSVFIIVCRFSLLFTSMSSVSLWPLPKSTSSGFRRSNSQIVPRKIFIWILPPKISWKTQKIEWKSKSFTKRARISRGNASSSKISIPFEQKSWQQNFSVGL